MTRNNTTFASSEELPQSPNIICRLTFFTSPRPGADIPGQDYYASGRPNSSFFQNLVGETYNMDPMRITPVQVPGHNSACYICGPQSFEKDMRSLLKDCGVSNQNIRSESFSVPRSSLHPRLTQQSRMVRRIRKTSWEMPLCVSQGPNEM